MDLGLIVLCFICVGFYILARLTWDPKKKYLFHVPLMAISFWILYFFVLRHLNEILIPNLEYEVLNTEGKPIIITLELGTMSGYYLFPFFGIIFLILFPTCIRRWKIAHGGTRYLIMYYMICLLVCLIYAIHWWVTGKKFGFL